MTNGGPMTPEPDRPPREVLATARYERRMPKPFKTAAADVRRIWLEAADDDLDALVDEGYELRAAAPLSSPVDPERAVVDPFVPPPGEAEWTREHLAAMSDRDRLVMLHEQRIHEWDGDYDGPWHYCAEDEFTDACTDLVNRWAAAPVDAPTPTLPDLHTRFRGRVFEVRLGAVDGALIETASDGVLASLYPVDDQ